MAGFHTKTFTKHDDYMTPKSAWEAIKQYIPKNKVIWEPFYTLKNWADEEHVLQTLNSQESDTWLRWFTENNLSQFAVKAIPCY